MSVEDDFVNKIHLVDDLKLNNRTNKIKLLDELGRIKTI